MKVISCEPSQMAVSADQYNVCTFEIIDTWNPAEHAKTCDTMFYLSDGTGAYVWNCDHWQFLDFSGATQPDWNAAENEAGGIKNKPFDTLNEDDFLITDGVLNISSKFATVQYVDDQVGDIEAALDAILGV